MCSGPSTQGSPRRAAARSRALPRALWSRLVARTRDRKHVQNVRGPKLAPRRMRKSARGAVLCTRTRAQNVHKVPRGAPRRGARRGAARENVRGAKLAPGTWGAGVFFYCSFSRAPSARAPRLFARLVCVRLAGGYLCAQEGPPRVQTFQGPPAGARPGSQPGLAFGARGAAREVRDPQEGLRAFCVRVRAYKTHTKTFVRILYARTRVQNAYKVPPGGPLAPALGTTTT